MAALLRRWGPSARRAAAAPHWQMRGLLAPLAFRISSPARRRMVSSSTVVRVVALSPSLSARCWLTLLLLFPGCRPPWHQLAQEVDGSPVPQRGPSSEVVAGVEIPQRCSREEASTRCRRGSRQVGTGQETAAPGECLFSFPPCPSCVCVCVEKRKKG